MTNILKNLFGELRTIPPGLGCMNTSCEGCEWEDKERERLEKEIINTILELVKKDVESIEPTPELDVYLDKVKNGNKDDMYDYGVVCERKKISTIINNLRV